MDETRPLRELRADFRGGSTNSMPIAGMVVWAALGIAALFLDAETTATAALYIMMAILPFAWLLDRMRGRNLFASNGNPLEKLFLSSIVGIAVTIPAIVIGAARGQPTLIVLGMAILAGVIWIPYGWAADDPVGMRHAVGRAVGAYAAYAFAPDPLKATAICAVVVLAYLYSLSQMRTTGQPTPAGAA